SWAAPISTASATSTSRRPTPPPRSLDGAPTAETAPVFRPLKVVDLELSRPLDSVHDLTGPGEVQALVRWHGIPLGRFTSAASAVDGADVTRAIAVQHWRTLMRRRMRAALQAAQPLDHLRLDDLQQITPPLYTGPRPLVTVAVCTRNRPDDLAHCLDALMQLDYPALDLLVVDNAPDGDATARLVAGRSPRVRRVCEPRP